MRNLQVNLTKIMSQAFTDQNFLAMIRRLENGIAKILSVALVVVILVALFDLMLLLAHDLIQEPVGFFNRALIDVFGLFLNILIALELLENISSYLRENSIRLELVISTSLIAIARKIIIFDFSKYGYLDLIALGVAIFVLSISYLLIKRLNSKIFPSKAKR